MIPLLMGLLTGHAWRILVAGLLAALLAWHIGHEHEARVAAIAIAVQTERDAWEARKQAEMARQDEISRRALDDAKNTAERLQSENSALAGHIEELTHAAQSDPLHARACLGSDSVRRLNAIR